MPIVLGLGVLVTLYSVLGRSSAAKIQAGQANAGIGGSHTMSSGVKAFPVGTIATSIAQLGSSIFGGAGTHAPVDPSIRSAGGTGPMIVSGGANDPTRIPESSQIVTTLEDNSSTSGITVGIDSGPEVTADDYWSD